jgi:transcription elongation factor Elf1
MASKGLLSCSICGSEIKQDHGKDSAIARIECQGCGISSDIPKKAKEIEIYYRRHGSNTKTENDII